MDQIVDVLALSKRRRGPNYSEEEKLRCFKLVAREKEIVECRKTDSATWRLKAATWKNIAKCFNALAPRGAPKRTAKNLKEFYDNQRKKARKNVKSEINKMATDEESFSNVVDGLTFDILSTESVLALTDSYDMDADEECNSSETSKIDIEENTPIEVKTENDSGCSSDSLLSPPVDERLKPTNESEQKVENWNRRRRPTRLRNTTTNIARTYGDIASTRKQVAMIQLDLVKKEMEHQERKFRAEEMRWEAEMAAQRRKAEMQEELMAIQIQIKRKILKSLDD